MSHERKSARAVTVYDKWGVFWETGTQHFLLSILLHFISIASQVTVTLNRTVPVMAFFGLTALGAQEPLAVSTDAVQHLHIFTDDDWKFAFERSSQRIKKNHAMRKEGCLSPGGSRAIPVKYLAAVIKEVYRGPVPPADLKLLEKWLPSLQDGTIKERITSFELLAAVQSARAEAEHLRTQSRFTLGPSCESKSWEEYSNNVRKCKAGKRPPPNKQTIPLTAQQEIGWETHTYVPVTPCKAKRSCEETKFALEKMKAGYFF